MIGYTKSTSKASEEIPIHGAELPCCTYITRPFVFGRQTCGPHSRSGDWKTTGKNPQIVNFLCYFFSELIKIASLFESGLPTALRKKRRSFGYSANRVEKLLRRSCFLKFPSCGKSRELMHIPCECLWWSLHSPPFSDQARDGFLARLWHPHPW